MLEMREKESYFDSYLLNGILIPELYAEIFSTYLISFNKKRLSVA
jgi:hypothetical protein